MIHALSLALGLVMLCAGAEALVRGARSFGLRVGVSPVLVGLTFVAYGTSTPELVVSTEATLEGQDGIALASIVGSNICNVLLILGLCALIRPMSVHARILRVEAPMLLVVSALVSLLLLAGELQRLEGVLLVTGLVTYTFWTVRLARVEAATVVKHIHQAQPAPTSSGWVDLGLTAAGLALLVAGSSFFVRAAGEGAAALGIPPAVVGLTVVAVGTSIPELATSLVAAVRGQGDIAIGNIVGSNVFNLTGVLGIAAVVDPIGPGGARSGDLFAMIASALVLLALLHTRSRLERWEGALLLAGYGLYLCTLIE